MPNNPTNSRTNTSARTGRKKIWRLASRANQRLNGQALTTSVYKRCSARLKRLSFITDLMNKAGIINPSGQLL